MSKIENFAVTFVIQGQEFPVEINPIQPVREGVVKALQQSGNSSNPNEWKIRTESGHEVYADKSFEEQEIKDSIKLFLNKGPGRGGITTS